MSHTAKLSILEKAFGEYTPLGQEYMFFCPEGCHEVKKKLSVNLEKNKYHCWICGYGGQDIKFLLIKYAKQYVNQWEQVAGASATSNWRSSEGYTFLQGKEVKEKWVFYYWDTWQKLLYNEWDSQRDEIKEYLKRKRITREKSLIWNMRVSDQDKNSILVPSFDVDGGVNYFSKRRFGADEEIKFFRPKVQFEIFNDFWLDFTKPIYLVENVFDATRFDISEVMPILGSEFRKYSIFIENCLKHETKVMVFLDAGEDEKSHKVFENLMGFGVDAYIVDNIFGKDIDLLDDWQLKMCKSSFVKNEDVLQNYVRNKLLRRLSCE
jgi:hypothetical protein